MWVVLSHHCVSFQLVQEKEKVNLELVSSALKEKLEIAESNCIRTEIEIAKMRSISTTWFISLIFIIFWARPEYHDSFPPPSGQLESEVSLHTQLINAKDAELLASKDEVTIIYLTCCVEVKYQSNFIKHD